MVQIFLRAENEFHLFDFIKVVVKHKLKKGYILGQFNEQPNFKSKIETKNKKNT